MTRAVKCTHTTYATAESIERSRKEPMKQSMPTAYSSSCSSLSTATSSWQEEIQLAIEDSKSGQSSIDAAHTACSRWESILLDQNSSSASLFLPAPVQTLCCAMYASCLVRIGRDDRAIGVFEQALLLIANREDPSARDLLLGKAKAHQRLLQYSEAFETYSELVQLARNNKVPLDISDVIGAVTCSLRLQQPQQANEILSSTCDFLEKEQAEEMESEHREQLQRDSTEVKIFLSILHHCMKPSTFLQQRNKNAIEKRIRPTISSLRNEYPLYVWLNDSVLLESIQQGAASIGSENSLDAKSIQKANDAFLALMKINQSPWDDPCLLQLDDKVLFQDMVHMEIKSCRFKK